MGDEEVDILKRELREEKIKISDQDLRRALRHTGYRVYTSAELIRNRTKWLETNALDDLTVADVHKELKKGYLQYVRGAKGHEGRPIVIFRARHFFPKHDADEATVSKRISYSSTSTMDFTRTIMFVMNLALKHLEEKTKGGADGIILFMDMRDASIMKNFDKTMFNKIVSNFRSHFPETIHRIFVLNSSIALKASSVIVTSALGKRTLKKVSYGTTTGSSKDCESTMSEIFDTIPKKFVPEEFRGRFEVCEPSVDVREMAKKAGVDLRRDAGKKNKKHYANEEFKNLNGMQYAGRSVQQVLDSDVSLRGVIYRKEGNKSTLFSKHVWKKFYAVLRPEALLLFEDINSKNAFHIVPLSEAKVKRLDDSSFKQKAFRVNCKDKRFHILRADSQDDCSRWIEHVDEAIHALVTLENRTHDDMVKDYENEQNELLDLMSEPVGVSSSSSSSGGGIFDDPFANISGTPTSSSSSSSVIVSRSQHQQMGVAHKNMMGIQQHGATNMMMMMMPQNNSGVMYPQMMQQSTPRPAMMHTMSSMMQMPAQTMPLMQPPVTTPGMSPMMMPPMQSPVTTPGISPMMMQPRVTTPGMSPMMMPPMQPPVTTPGMSSMMMSPMQPPVTTSGVSPMMTQHNNRTQNNKTMQTSASTPIAPLPLDSAKQFGVRWKTCTCEKKLNVLTSAQTPERISKVLESHGFHTVSMILKTSEVICAGKLKTNGSICLVHARVVSGKGATLTVRTQSEAFTSRLGAFLYSKMKAI